MPTCLHLQPIQLERLTRFYAFLSRLSGWNEACEEDCSCASPVTFSIYATGLGDCIKARAMGYTCELTIDDDGELCGDENWIAA